MPTLHPAPRASALSLTERFAVRVATPRQEQADYRKVNEIVRWGFYGFILSLMFDYQDRTIPMELPTLTGFIFLFITFVQPQVCYRRLPNGIGWYIGYVVAYAVICMTVKHLDDAVKQLVLMVQLVFLLWACYNLLSYEEIAHTTILLMILSGLILVAMMLSGIGVYTMYEHHGKRYSLFGQDPNRLACFMSFSVVALIAYIFNLKKRPFWLVPIIFALAGVSYYAISMTGSRGGGMVSAAGFIAFAFTGKTILQRVRNFLIAALAITGLIVSVNFSPYMKARYERSYQEQNLAGREEIVPACLDMFQERPITGWGPIDNKFELGIRAPIQRSHHPEYERDTHNMFLEALTSMGLLGSVPLFIFLLIGIWKAWQSRKGAQGNIPLALVIAGLMMQMSLNGIIYKIFWVFIAYALISGEVAKRRKKPPPPGAHGRTQQPLPIRVHKPAAAFYAGIPIVPRSGQRSV